MGEGLDFGSAVVAVMIGSSFSTCMNCNGLKTIESKVSNIENEISSTNKDVNRIKEDLGNISRKTTSILSQYKVLSRNGDIIGNPAQEVYYELNGQRCYIEIDGKPIDIYVKTKVKKQNE